MAALDGWRWTRPVSACLVMVAAVVLAGCGGGGGGGTAATWRFRVTDLGTLGGDTSDALAVNDSGQVVGWSRLAGTDTFHAFRYAGGNLLDLGTLAAGGNSRATGINNSGVICGTSNVATDNQRAFRYLNQQMQDLGTLGVAISATACGINNAGEIVGGSGGRPFLWAGGQMQELPTPGGSGEANAVNRDGMVAGWFWLDGMSAAHAFRGTLAEATDLGALGGTGSGAFAINDRGECAGYYVDGANKRLFIYRNGTMQNIGTLGGAQGEAHGINNTGIVVGNDGTAAGPSHAFLWDGTIRDLNDLLDAASQGWTLTRANDISNHNVIVGQGLAPNGQYHAFLARRI